jgi:hypothetical protein|tara:strand:- start:617 stop:913 length:297 start_codon:yes stop_codon:yes gene_type:complete
MTYNDYKRFYLQVYIRLSDFNYNIIKWWKYNNKQLLIEQRIIEDMLALVTKEEIPEGFYCSLCNGDLLFDDDNSELWWCERCHANFEPWEVEEGKIYD